jgi:hypothetical protein
MRPQQQNLGRPQTAPPTPGASIAKPTFKEAERLAWQRRYMQLIPRKGSWHCASGQQFVNYIRPAEGARLKPQNRRLSRGGVGAVLVEFKTQKDKKTQNAAFFLECVLCCGVAACGIAFDF